MSLRVWLPLNGDLRNQGLSGNITFTTTGSPTIDENGKIGKCYTFNGSSYFQTAESFLSSMTECTLSCWVKNTYTGSSWMRIFGIGEHTRVHLDTNGSGQVRFFVSKDGSTSSYWGPIGKTDTRDSTWHHVCGTFNSSQCKIYIDGKCETTVTTGSLPTVTGGKLYLGHIGDGIKLTGSLCDIRVYNHALSEKEVEDLSKGLVAHYPLSNPIPLNGLKYDKTIYTESDGSQWVRIFHHNNPKSALFASTDNWSAGVYKDANRWFDIYGIINHFITFEFMVKQCLTSGATISKYRWIQNKNPLVATYADVAPGAVTRITTSGYTDGGQGGLYVTNKNAHMCIANANNGNWYGALGAWTAYNNGIPAYPNTTVTTGYIDLYIKISDYQGEKIYDCSGYQHNGTIVGELTAAAGSPRYDGAISMNNTSTSNHIEADAIGVSDNIFTVSFWVKSAKSTNQVLFADPKIVVGTLGSSIYVSPTTAAGFTTTHFNDNGWNHIVAIRNNTTYQVYVNGQAETQSAGNNYYAHNATALWLFNRSYNNNYAANTTMSDVRIYTTALTAAQVAELYKISMLVDASGNVSPRPLE